MSLLSQQSQVNADSAFFAPASGGGGGGGGGGPNPSVSSLTLAPGTWSPLPSSGIPGTINFSGKVALVNGPDQMTAQLTSPANGAVQWELITPGGDGGGVMGADGTNTWIGALSGHPIHIGTAVSGAVAPVYMSSLTVSSINGATPGGGGAIPSDLTVSTLTAATNVNASAMTTSTITFPQVSSCGLVYAGGSITSPVAINLTPLVGQYGNTGVIGAWGQEVYQGHAGWGEFATQRLYLTDVTGGATATTYIENYGNQIQIATPSSIALQAPTYVSSMNVSSINGAAYPPPGSGPTRVSVASLANVSVLGNATPTVISADFTTVSGHLYTLNGFIYGIASPNTNSNASVAFQVGNNDHAYGAPFPAVGYSAASGAAYGNTMAVNITWRSGASAADRLYAQMLDVGGTAVSTFTNAVANLDLIDWGAVA